ncbi:MAG: proteasome assembly chaperone family protein [Candidatus Micrarchaeaceae archaeon]
MYFNPNVKLRNPVMLVGLPGIGSVGSLVCEHIKNELKAEKFATLYSPYLPHQVLMLKSGNMRLLNNRFYYWKNPSKDKDAKDIVILLGDAQAVSSRGQYEISEMIVKFFKSIGGKEIFTIGGYSVSDKYIQNPKVYGVSPFSEIRKEFRQHGAILGSTVGMIWGAAGLIVFFAKKHNVQSGCLLGETGLLEVDANSARSVLKVITELLGIKISTENLEKIKKETEAMLARFEELASAEQKSSTENLTYIR